MFSTMPRIVDLLAPLSLLALVYHIILWVYKSWARGANVPQGPPTFPILGNIMVMPKARLHIKFMEWAKAYGDVFSLKIINQIIIVISSPTHFHELIDKRSVSSSNRPKSILADMITPNNMNMGTGRFANSTWKSMRRASAQLLNNENMRRLSEYQRAEATQLMWELSHQPDEWFSHIRRYTTSFASGIIYGVRGPTLSSPHILDFMDVHPKFLHALEIGTMPPVDLFPILTLVPERWANWKRAVKHVRVLHERLFDGLLSIVEERVRKGNGTGVFMEQMISSGHELGLKDRDHLMHLGGVLLEGSDTCSAALQNIAYAFTIFPHVLEKAREEVDRVVGTERAPDWEDIPNLPYTMAVIEECNRYRPVGPLGLPHEMVQEEIIDGVVYPKDAVIFANLYGMFHDERYFESPEEFLPERFLSHPLGVKQGIKDDPARRPNMLFGGGRRVCPGIAFAKTSLEINVANFVWGFNFFPAFDPLTGKEKYPSFDDHSTGVTATPRPFPLRIVPRSAHHMKLIDMQFSTAADVLSAYELEITAEDRMFNSKYRDHTRVL
ncbi:cytochrome P450 [Infundibulicybe gibba]|nr:cytochrome P450 [Infundibulicybe gibba]